MFVHGQKPDLCVSLQYWVELLYIYPWTETREVCVPAILSGTVLYLSMDRNQRSLCPCNIEWNCFMFVHGQKPEEFVSLQYWVKLLYICSWTETRGVCVPAILSETALCLSMDRNQELMSLQYWVELLYVPCCEYRNTHIYNHIDIWTEYVKFAGQRGLINVREFSQSPNLASMPLFHKTKDHVWALLFYQNVQFVLETVSDFGLQGPINVFHRPGFCTCMTHKGIVASE